QPLIHSRSAGPLYQVVSIPTGESATSRVVLALLATGPIPKSRRGWLACRSRYGANVAVTTTASNRATRNGIVRLVTLMLVHRIAAFYGSEDAHSQGAGASPN